MKERLKAVSKTHQRYRLADGTIVPSVTSILGILAKPALVHWAWKLGTEGIDYRTYTNEAKAVGALVHEMILAHFKEVEVDYSNYTKNQIEMAENSFLSFLEWAKKHKFEPILIEMPLVSEKYRFGGTPDFYGRVDGVPGILDFKSGSGIYEEYCYQVGGYKILLNEVGYEVRFAKLIRITREEDEQFEVKNIDYDPLIHYETIFLSIRSLYGLIKNK
jgi:hypothetical protein